MTEDEKVFIDDMKSWAEVLRRFAWAIALPVAVTFALCTLACGGAISMVISVCR